ncbi:MAG: hypothetical protein H6R10_2340 [Rhodocyclaceae bacterium]|nr:hypothetical protein [Rhodocyclaceae bacterium]
MSRFLRLTVLMPILFLTSACVGPLPRIETSPTALANIRTIAVIRPPEPDLYTVINFGNAGMAAVAGVLGGAAAGGVQVNMMAQVTQNLKHENPSIISQALPESITQELNKRGYEARIEDGPWERQEGGAFQLQWDKIDSSADGVLVVIPTIVGFVAKGLTADYMPTVIAGVTLVGKNRNDKLYRGFHSSGWIPSGDGWRRSEPKITFPNFDSILADQQKAAASLRAGAASVAITVAEDLKR